VQPFLGPQQVSDLIVVAAGDPGRVDAHIEPLVGNFGDSDVRLARIGVAAIFELGFREDLEERSLAYLGQADDASFHLFPMAPLHDTLRASGPLR